MEASRRHWGAYVHLLVDFSSNVGLSTCMSVCVCVCVCVSLSTILKISKNAGVLLRPHVSLLVVSLLESVTTLEPQMMNYLSLHAAANQATADKVPSYLIGYFPGEKYLVSPRDLPSPSVLTCESSWPKLFISSCRPVLTNWDESAQGFGLLCGIVRCIVFCCH